MLVFFPLVATSSAMNFKYYRRRVCKNLSSIVCYVRNLFSIASSVLWKMLPMANVYICLFGYLCFCHGRDSRLSWAGERAKHVSLFVSLLWNILHIEIWLCSEDKFMGWKSRHWQTNQEEYAHSRKEIMPIVCKRCSGCCGYAAAVSNGKKDKKRIN